MEITFDVLLQLFTRLNACLRECEDELEREYYKGQCDILSYLIKKEKKAKGIERVIVRDLDDDWRVEL